MPQVGGGLLAVLADPLEGMAAELDRWLEDEHLYERSAIDGILFSRRYVSLEGKPYSLALYELSSPEVLHGEAYLGARRVEEESRAAENAARAAAGNVKAQIPSSGQRMTSLRNEYELIFSGGRHPGELGAFIWMVREEPVGGADALLEAWYVHEHLPLVAAIAGVRGVKRYRATAGTPKYLTIYELATAEVVRGDAWQRAFATSGATHPRPEVTNVATNLAQFFKVVSHDDGVREMADHLSDYSKRV